MKTVAVTIGEKSYIVREAKRRANARWRQRFQAEFTGVADLIEGLPKTQLTAEALGGLLHQIISKVGGSVDTLAELVFEYAPELAADRETIEEEAYDSEIMAAFTAVLQLAYPFGSVIQALTGLVDLGRTDKATLPNSSSSTDSTTPTLTE